MTQQDEDSYSDNSDSVEVKINWESLKGKLSAGALEALQQHVQDPAREQPNAASTEDVGEDTIARYSSDSNSNGRGALLPDSNKAYKLKEYWDDRFKTEEHYDVSAYPFCYVTSSTYFTTCEAVTAPVYTERVFSSCIFKSLFKTHDPRKTPRYARTLWAQFTQKNIF